jgi:hypothetical protein
LDALGVQAAYQQAIGIPYYESPCCRLKILVGQWHISGVAQTRPMLRADLTVIRFWRSGDQVILGVLNPLDLQSVGIHFRHESR